MKSTGETRMNPLLQYVRCPITHERLAELTPQELENINQAIRQGNVCDRSGDPVESTWTHGLINESRTWIYPVWQHGAALIADQAVAGDQLRANQE